LNSSEGIVSKANEDVFYKLEVREVASRSNLSYFESCPAAGYARPEEHPLFSHGLMIFGENRGRLPLMIV